MPEVAARKFYKHLYFQVLVAILLGAFVGFCFRLLANE